MHRTEHRMAHLEGAYEQVTHRLGSIDNRLDGVERRLTGLEMKIDGRADSLDRKIDAAYRSLSGLMFGSWVSLMLAIVAAHFWR